MENNKDQHPKMSSIPNGFSPDPLAPMENNSDLSDDREQGEEIDADDAIHNAAQEPTEENEQQDADDAVHKTHITAKDSLHENDEKDPDDLVHGR